MKPARRRLLRTIALSLAAFAIIIYIGNTSRWRIRSETRRFFSRIAR